MNILSHLLSGLIGFLAGLKAREIWEVWKVTHKMKDVLHHLKFCPHVTHCGHAPKSHHFS